MPWVPRSVDGLSCILSFSVMSSKNLFAFPSLCYSSPETVTYTHRKIWSERSSDHLANEHWSGPLVLAFFKNMVQAEAAQEGKAERSVVSQKRPSSSSSSPGFLSQGMIIAAQLAKMSLVIWRQHARAGTILFPSDLPFSNV